MFASGWWPAFARWGSFPTRSLYCVSKACFLSDYMLFLTFWVCLTRPELLNSCNSCKKTPFDGKNLIIPFPTRKFPLGKVKFLHGTLDPVQGKCTARETATRADPRAFPTRNTLRKLPLERKYLIRRRIKYGPTSQKRKNPRANRGSAPRNRRGI